MDSESESSGVNVVESESFGAESEFESESFGVELESESL